MAPYSAESCQKARLVDARTGGVSPVGAERSGVVSGEGERIPVKDSRSREGRLVSVYLFSR